MPVSLSAVCTTPAIGEPDIFGRQLLSCPSRDHMDRTRFCHLMRMAFESQLLVKEEVSGAASDGACERKAFKDLAQASLCPPPFSSSNSYRFGQHQMPHLGRDPPQEVQAPTGTAPRSVDGARRERALRFRFAALTEQASLYVLSVKVMRFK